MKNSDKKALGKNLFINSNLNRKQIAEQIGCTEKTLRTWIENDNWEDLKNSLTITRPQLLQESYAQLKAINEKIKNDFGGVPNKELSDAKGIIRKEIELFSFQPIHKYVEVFEDFIDYLNRNMPSQLNDFTISSQAFIQEISKRKT